jgi:hypothetical protein
LRGRLRVCDTEPRQVALNRCIQTDLPRFNQLHHCERGERFRNGSQKEWRLRRWCAAFSAGRAKAVHMYDRFAVDNRQDRAGNCKAIHLLLNVIVDLLVSF